MTNNYVTQNYLDSNFTRPIALLNGGFNRWSRGTSLSATELTAFSNYCADNWMLTLPTSQTGTISKITDFVTSNNRANKAFSLALSSATSSLSSSTQYGLSQRLEGTYARDYLYRSVTFSGKVKTNVAGVYSAYISWHDTASSNVAYCVMPVTLLGSEAEETFTVTFPPCPSTFTPEKGEAFSVKVGLILAGNATTVTGVYLTEAASAETYCHTSQVNLFASSSNYIKFSQITLTPGLTAAPYRVDSLEYEALLCKRYVERLSLSSHLVNLYANTTLHTGSLSYQKKAITPSLIFQQTDESKASISNSSAVYYVGTSTAFTLSTFAAAGRTTNLSTGFTFNTTSSTPAGTDTGNINLDVLVIANI